jgi:hypothetical protein
MKRYNTMLGIIKSLFCKHKHVVYITNVCGDCIYIWSNGDNICRSLWYCKDCGKIIRSSKLLSGEKAKINDFTRISKEDLNFIE